MLALVWAAKHFRCYLYGRKFEVRTDHAALTYLKNVADQNARLMRCSMKLSELQFTVEHRAGKKIPHADALSRSRRYYPTGDKPKPKGICPRTSKGSVLPKFEVRHS